MKEEYNYELAVRLLARHLQKDESVVLDMCKNGDRMYADKWSKLNPKTEKERNYFYSLDTQIFGQVNWHFYDAGGRRSQLAGRLKGNVLDYGCGIATEAIFSARDGLTSIDLFDLDGATKEFVQYIISYFEISNTIRYIDTLPDYKKYDTIVCTDVLEHFEDPVKILLVLKAVLKDDGILLWRAPSGDWSPSHIHKVFNPYEWFEQAGIKNNEEVAV